MSDHTCTETKQIITIDGPHYAKLVCKECERFIQWITNPEKPKNRSNTIKKQGISKQCCFCGRKKEELGIRQTLEADHMIPLSEGGEDNVRNIMTLCTACHKLKNYMSLYWVKHLRKGD